MTTEEWQEISKLIEECDYYGLAEEIASRTYDLDINKQELDRIIKDYKSERLELGLSPNVSIQNDGHKCVIECEGHTYEFEFPQPISHVVQLANTKNK